MREGQLIDKNTAVNEAFESARVIRESINRRVANGLTTHAISSVLD